MTVKDRKGKKKTQALYGMQDKLLLSLLLLIIGLRGNNLQDDAMLGKTGDTL